MTTGTTRAERKLHTRALLVAAARRRVASHGFAALSVRDLTREADIVPTAFYRHFESVDQLAVEVADGAVADLRALVDSLVGAAGDPVVDWPPLLVAAGTASPESWPALGRASLDAGSPAHELVAAAVAEARRRVAIALSRVVGLDHHTPDGIDALADVVVAELLRTPLAAAGRADLGAAAARDAGRRLAVLLR